MQVEINNLSGARVSRAVFKKAVAAFAASTGQSAKTAVSLAFLTDAAMKKHHLIYSGFDCTTDVLSFSAHEGRGVGFQVTPEQRNFLGEILISYPQASKQAKEYGLTISAELVNLLIHGLLHLIGYDHQNARQQQRMQRQADLIIRNL